MGSIIYYNTFSESLFYPLSNKNLHAKIFFYPTRDKNIAHIDFPKFNEKYKFSYFSFFISYLVF